MGPLILKTDIICDHRFSIRPENKDLWYLEHLLNCAAVLIQVALILSKIGGEGPKTSPVCTGLYISLY